MRKIVKRNNMSKDGSILDTKTGEIIESEAYASRIIFEEITYDETSKFQTDVRFVKVFRGIGMELSKKLTHAEASLVMCLWDLICYEDCALRFNGNSQGRLLDIRDIAEICDLNYNTIRKNMYSLKAKEVIGFHETGQGEDATRMITVNPYIFCRGINISDWVIGFYKNTYWAKLDKDYTSSSLRTMSKRKESDQAEEGKSKSNQSM